MIHILFTASLHPPTEPYRWEYPSTPAEKLRCRVFKHLWEEGYYLTAAGKFGGDFLCYPGIVTFLKHRWSIALTLKVVVATIDAWWEGMGDVGSARYEPA